MKVRFFILLAALVFIPQWSWATMGDYCSMPPFATNTNPPNLLILMDNSEDMLNAAYGPTYDASQEYLGYFDPNKSYTYTSNEFEMDPDGLFSGNVLNWATTSKYDLLQKILIGGATASRQSNAHTLISISGEWSRTYGDCALEVSSGNLTISGDACSMAAGGEATCSNPYDEIDSIGVAKDNQDPKINNPSKNSLPDATLGNCYVFSFEAQWGATEDEENELAKYTWSIPSGSLPRGLELDGSSGTIWGVPGLEETSTFTIQVADHLGATASKEVTIDVTSATASLERRYDVKVYLEEEPLDDLNGNDIWDEGETYTDSNNNGAWDGKQGIFQTFWDEDDPKAYWGLMDFNHNEGAVIERCIDPQNSESMYSHIQNSSPTDAAPLGTGLYSAVDYMGNLGLKSFRATSCGDPTDSEVPCRKNFVLIISSGAAVDGTSFSASSGCDYSDPLVQNACYGYRKVGDETRQNIFTYVVNTMGTENNDILAKTACVGGGGTDCDTNYVSNRNYFEATDASELETEIVRALNAILDRASSGTAVSVLTTSSRGVGSMIQAYFLPSRLEGTREVSWTGYGQNLWIDPKDNLREDTEPQDAALKLDEDKVLKIFYDDDDNETKAGLFTTDADGEGGTLDSCTATEGEIKLFSDIDPLWEAGEKLALKAPSSRTIFTSSSVRKGTTLLDLSSAEDDTTGRVPFTATTVTGDSTLSAALDPEVGLTAENIIDYIRGECLETDVSGDNACGATTNSDFRDRRINVSGGDPNGNVWKLGDIISSTPKVLSNTPANNYHIEYGDGTYHAFVSDSTYRDRTSLALVGANDGMVHAFRVGYLKDRELTTAEIEEGVKAKFQEEKDNDETDDLGKEEWAFIPFNVFPYLKYLADPGYCHIYYNDLSIRLVDASVEGAPDDLKTKESWRTIMVGGMRFGGACENGTTTPPTTVSNVGYSAYYAIDVTDPLNPQPLWEFSDPDLGYSTTYPSIVRTGASNVNGNWYVAVGSGSTTLPDYDTDIGRSTAGCVYLLDLETGERVQKITLDHNAIVGDVLAIDANRDYSSEKLYFGTSYKDDDGNWRGKLVGVDIPNQDLSSWTADTGDVAYLFDGGYPFTASPDATLDDVGNIWVYAGSGKYYSEVDEADASDQIFLGIKDSSPLSALTTADLTDRSSFNTTGTVATSENICMYDQDNDAFGLQTVVTSISPTSTMPGIPANGWYLTLSGGERVITRPLAIGGVVDFLTYLPSDDVCAFGGESYLYAVDYLRGVAPTNVAIRAAGSTTSSGDGVIVNKKVLLGPGAPPTGDAIIIPPPKQGQENLKKKIQIATGVIVEAENKPVHSVISKIIHWLKK